MHGGDFLGAPGADWASQGLTRGLRGFQNGGPHGRGGSHCTQIALLRFTVCSRRNSRLIGDSRTPLRKLRPWNTATLTTGEFITGFWGSLRRHPTWAWTLRTSPTSHHLLHCLHDTWHGQATVRDVPEWVLFLRTPSASVQDQGSMAELGCPGSAGMAGSLQPRSFRPTARTRGLRPE